MFHIICIETIVQMMPFNISGLLYVSGVVHIETNAKTANVIAITVDIIIMNDLFITTLYEYS